MNFSNRVTPSRRQQALWTVGLLALVVLAAARGQADPPASESGVVEITDLPASQSAGKLELPEEPSRIAQAFVIRRRQPMPSKASPVTEPAPPDPANTASPKSTPHKVDPEVRPAHRIERTQPTPARANALLLVARQMAVEARSTGDFTDVIDQCHRALDANPDRATGEALARLGAWAHNRRGEHLVRSNERAAFDDFQEAILLDPACWEAIHNRGVTLARYDKLELALADFTRVIELEPGFHLARFNRAETYCQLARWEEALIDYTATIKSMPDEPLAFAGRAQAQHHLALYREAMADYNRALAIDGGCEKALVGRALVYADQGEWTEAAADFRRALKTGDPTASTYRAVARFLATCPDPNFRDPEKAIEAARRALTMMGDDDAPSHDLLAAACAAAGQYVMAVEHQQRALQHVAATQRADYQARLQQYQQAASNPGGMRK